MAERPGRRALFTGTSAQKRNTVPAPAEGVEADNAAVQRPDPVTERMISAVTRALNGALSGVRSPDLNPEELGDASVPLVDAVNAAISRLTEAPPDPPELQPGLDPALLREKDAEIEDLQQRIAMIIQQHPLPVILLSPDLSIIEANSAFCQMSGLLRSQLIRHQVSVIAERERQGDGLATAIRQRLPVEAEITADLPAGIKMLKQYAVPILDRSGAVEALQVIYIDQTAQKQEERARRSQVEEIGRQQQQYRNLVHGLPTPVMIIDGTDAVLDVNPAFCEMSGYSREHLLTVKLSDYPNLTALTAGAVLSPDQRRISREISVEFPTGLHILKEDLILLTDQSSEGLPKGMIILCAVEDISSRREGEQQVIELSSTVHQQKHLIDALMRETPIPILLLDTSAIIVSANEAFIQLSGSTLENLSGMNISAFPLLRETGLRIDEVMQQNEGAFGEVKMEFVSGIHELERYCFPLRDEKGTLTNLLVFFNDQTREKTQEKTIQTLEEQVQSWDSLYDMSVKNLAQGMSRMAGGEFTYHLQVDEGDPLGTIKEDFNTAADRVRAVIDQYELAGHQQQVLDQEGSGGEVSSAAEQAQADIVELMKQNLQESSGDVVQSLAILGTDDFIPLGVQDQDPLFEVRMAVNLAATRLAPVHSEGTGSFTPQLPEEIRADLMLPVVPEVSVPQLMEEVGPKSGLSVPAALMPATMPEVSISIVKEEEGVDPKFELTESVDLIPAPISEVSVPQVMEEEMMSESVISEPEIVQPDQQTVLPRQDRPVPKMREEKHSMEQNREDKQVSTTMVDVVAFEMAGQRYALDIQLAREIVEMIPITPIPRSPPYISGIINLRGEITNILNLYTLLGLPEQQVNENQKIIVLVPDAAEGINVGIIVDNVQSVTQVPVTDIEQIKDDASSDISGFVKGIIKAKSDDAEGKTTDLIIWIDMLKVLSRLVSQ